MNCVTKVNSSMFWNEETVREFNLKKGLRQGDPVSPYHFVLCMERLSNLITLKVSSGDWKGTKASARGPAISHLFFADDLLLFAKADSRNCDTIMDVLNQFSNCPGLKIDLAKSKLFVSPNVLSPRQGV